MEKRKYLGVPAPLLTPTLDGALFSYLGPYQEEWRAPRREGPLVGVLLSNPCR